MGRKIYIVPAGDMADPVKVGGRISEAEAQGIAEIADGIPPALVGIVTGELPQVYEEPDAPEPTLSEVDNLRSQVANLQQIVADIADLLLEKGVLP